MNIQIIDLSPFFGAVIQALKQPLQISVGFALGFWVIRTALRFLIDSALHDGGDVDMVVLTDPETGEEYYYDRNSSEYRMAAMEFSAREIELDGIRDSLNPSDFEGGGGDWASRPYDNDDMYE